MSGTSQRASPAPPSAKRRRTNLSDSNAEEQVVNSTEYWFSDGNIILQVENTRFRVHKSVLAIHSPILHDMFSVPQPPEGEEFVEGCPVVQLWDRAEDWELLLWISYRGVQYRLQENTRPHLNTVAALLRLGHKYEMADYRDHGRRSLSHWYQLGPFSGGHTGSTMQPPKPIGMSCGQPLGTPLPSPIYLTS
ncbi:hypothetical protein CC2G_013261 [Coprinopsis cinerea AmutBmut pab1-1]|nr:hypothetical protein CC2G_013261 [Coprinopsis cinerea AmutBmut pab1-1]